MSVASCSDGDGVAADDSAAAVTTADVDWLIARLRSMVTASSAVWAGRGMTLLQLIALQFISALAPVTVSGLAQVFGTRPPATSAMVDRLARAGLVRRSPDPQDRRRVHLTITSAAQPIVGDTDEDTAQHLSAVVHAIRAQTRRPLIDLLVDMVRRLAEESRTPRIGRATSESGPLTVRAGDGHSSQATARG
ncbi:MAG: MarR family transcriptional regulator [Actinomycetota bacterium]|nr:MarR family transcriptional regulator [Actinomycetota bacterium]